MEFNQTVMARRSLRAYEEGKTVEKAQIEELIRFAQMAPSWKNSQTGRYYVVMSRFFRNYPFLLFYIIGHIV